VTIVGRKCSVAALFNPSFRVYRTNFVPINGVKCNPFIICVQTPRGRVTLRVNNPKEV
jgi:hypothetical protein